MEKITIEYIFHFMLIFARLGTATARFPALNSTYFMPRAKLILALFISLIMLPILQPVLPEFKNNAAYMIGLIAIEILIGIIISFAANIYFQAINYVGQFISMQSGLSSANFFDPSQKAQISLFSNLIILPTILMIFATNTHYIFIEKIAESYLKFPPGELVNSGDLSEFVTFVVNDSFIFAFKLSAPFFIVSIAMLIGSGVLARIMPNLQVFFVITPAQILMMIVTLYIVINSMILKITDAVSTNIYPI